MSTQLANDISTWVYSNAELQSTSMTSAGAALAIVALGINIWITCHPQCRRPIYLWALVESFCTRSFMILFSYCLGCAEGLLASAYFQGARFANCNYKNILTTLILNLSPVIVCCSLTFVAEVAITSSKLKKQFRIASGILILAQLVSLLVRIGTATMSATNSAQCKIVTTVAARLVPLVLHLVTVLLYTGVFLASLWKNGLLQRAFPKTLSKAAQNSKAPEAVDTATSVVQTLTLSVNFLCLIVILSSIVAFISLSLSEAGIPLKIDTLAYGARTFFLALMSLFNCQAVLHRLGATSNHVTTQHGVPKSAVVA